MPAWVERERTDGGAVCLRRVAPWLLPRHDRRAARDCQFDSDSIWPTVPCSVVAPVTFY